MSFRDVNHLLTFLSNEDPVFVTQGFLRFQKQLSVQKNIPFNDTILYAYINISSEFKEFMNILDANANVEATSSSLFCLGDIIVYLFEHDKGDMIIYLCKKIDKFEDIGTDARFISKGGF
eukprot:UN27329